MECNRFAAVLALCLGLFSERPSEATLLTYTYTGSSVNIPDNNSTGASVNITVTDTWDLLAFDNVKVTLNHSWVGDLVATLTHVATGRTIDLFERPGKTNAGSGFGDDSNLNGTYTFTDSASNRIIDIARTTGANATVAPGNYRATTNIFNGNGNPNYTGEVIQNLNSTFTPISNISGVWRLTVADLAGADTGSITGFSFTVDAGVPEPGSMLLLGSALAAGSVWYRRQRSRMERSAQTTGMQA